MKTAKWGISKKLISAFTVIVLIMLVFIIYANSNFSVLLEQYDLALQNNKNLGEFFDSVNKAGQYLRNCLLYNDKERLGQFLSEYNKSFALINRIKSYVSDEYSYGKMVDLERMLRTYGEKANILLYSISSNSNTEAYSSLKEAENVNDLILGRYGFYAEILNKSTEVRRLTLLTSQRSQNFANLLLVVFLVILFILFGSIFIRRITRPIALLADNARKISDGNFNLPAVSVKSKDEVATLAGVFNTMVQSLQYYIDEMKHKARLQERLMEEENRNLRNETILKETQLNALQMKINPHFLFNTLNMIKQTAFLENAEETRTMIEATSQLLRFYLDKAGVAVSLKEELENVSNYIFIQKKRIGKRIAFDITIDSAISNIMLPGLIIQPLLENAIIHGLEDCIHDGRIEIIVSEQDKEVQIEVADNGKGIPENILKSIKEKKFIQNSSSIGLTNVMQRLELFYNTEGLLWIQSGPEGTRVTIRLPKNTAKEVNTGV